MLLRLRDPAPPGRERFRERPRLLDSIDAFMVFVVRRVRQVRLAYLCGSAEIGLLKTSMGGLPRAVEADSILRGIWIDDVHNSTAIEGNTMTRAQVEELVERGRASASLVEMLEVEGYASAADWVYRNAADYQ